MWMLFNGILISKHQEEDYNIFLLIITINAFRLNKAVMPLFNNTFKIL